MKLLKLKTEKEVTDLLWMLSRSASTQEEKQFFAVISDRLDYETDEFLKEE